MKLTDIIYLTYTLTIVILIGLWSVGISEVTNVILSIAMLITLLQYLIFCKLTVGLVTARFGSGNFDVTDLLSSILLRNTMLFIAYSSGHILLFGFMLPSMIISTIVTIFTLLHRYKLIEYTKFEDEE